ncbi:flagellar basal body P-ring formation chaperone FlgA [Fundidesulfovibrio agrisoli]|uniref:flagellar basal body P-ring formation chaperone FlgA n=1 Tax=Fundidesulfovibrio agrisoli TaxID=2922717 RepID=UPI001FAD58C3|nr:flagellar basal body P-ring formation chaperone FlgA [Fundidesulfovibrio agrisoli]
MNTTRTDRQRHRARALAVMAAVLALLAAATVFGADPMAWKVRIAPAAAIGGERVMLGDIAEPVGQIDPDTWRILSSTPLWPFPGREGQLTLTRKRILEDLDVLFPRSAGNFIVPEQVVLKKGGGVPVAGNDVTKMIVDYLTENMTGVEGELEVKEISLPGQLFIDPDTEKLSVESVGQMTPGRVNLRLTVSDMQGKPIRQIAASAFVNLWKVIPVAARPLNMRDGVVAGEMVTYERRNLAYIKGLPWDAKNPTPMRAKTSLNQGVPLTMDNLEPMPAILKGEQVTCLWNGRSIHLAMPVTAVTEGAKGCQITVRNVQSGRELAAWVQDSKTVVAR